jgi:hypothetical protein
LFFYGFSLTCPIKTMLDLFFYGFSLAFPIKTMLRLVFFMVLV